MVAKRANIAEITEYVKDLEEGLVEWDLNTIAMMVQISYVYEAIMALMAVSISEPDPKKRAVLAAVEYKARRCWRYMICRLSITN